MEDFSNKLQLSKEFDICADYYSDPVPEKDDIDGYNSEEENPIYCGRERAYQLAMSDSIIK